MRPCARRDEAEASRVDARGRANMIYPRATIYCRCPGITYWKLLRLGLLARNARAVDNNNRSRIYTFNALGAYTGGGPFPPTLLMFYPPRGIRFHSPLPYYCKTERVARSINSRIANDGASALRRWLSAAQNNASPSERSLFLRRLQAANTQRNVQRKP